MSISQLTFFDTVCGMELDATQTKYAHEHNGKTYYFCSQMCHKHFKDSPERYIGEEEEITE